MSQTSDPQNHTSQTKYEDGISYGRNYQNARRLYALATVQGIVEATMRLRQLHGKNHTECPLLGDQVILNHTSRSDLNGKKGVEKSFDHSRGRYVLVLRK